MTLEYAVAFGDDVDGVAGRAGRGAGDVVDEEVVAVEPARDRGAQRD